MSELNAAEVVEVEMTGSEGVEAEEAMVDEPSVGEVGDEGAGEVGDEAVEEVVGDAWQRRAEEAEARLVSVAEQLGEVEHTARELHEAIEVQRVGRMLDVELLRAGVSDLDAARRAVLGQLEAGDGGVCPSGDSIEVEVGRLATARPGLFAAGGAGGVGGVGGVMRSRASGAQVEADRAADAARSSGDRRQLLRYLRLRRASE